jgi:Flp pilus assembly pilin Flp
MRADLPRLWHDERGQDLIEYALLTTFIGLAAIAVFNTLLTAIGSAYGTFNTSSNNLWQPPAPAGS